MRDLSVVIPARNEMFLSRTVENVLANARADTEIIAICDGYEPYPPLPEDERVVVVRHEQSIGQRAATNEGAGLSTARYVMKLDAHCAVDEGFDAKLMEDCEPDVTLIPTLYTLHAFDWKCDGCGDRTYQGSRPTACGKCGDTRFEIVMVWEPNWHKRSRSWIFDADLHFQYSRRANKVADQGGTVTETMSCNGPCFFMERERYLEMGGVDENHGSWGQYGTELACKAWLSGGRMLTTKRTWFSHLFRTGNFTRHGESAFPYPLSGEAQQRARDYSQDYWRNSRWLLAKRPLSWLVERFWPVKGWTQEDIDSQKRREAGRW